MIARRSGRLYALVILLVLAGLFVGVLSGCANVHSAAATATQTPTSTPVPPTPAPPTPVGGIPVVGAAISCDPGTASPPSNVLTCQYSGPNSTRMTFYLYVPGDYAANNSERYPLVLILQGGGERAKPGNTAAQNRILALNQPYVRPWIPQSSPDTSSVQTRWPSFIIVPQVVGSNRYVNVSPHVGSYALATQPSIWLQMAINIVALIQREYPAIDANRLYITGISMGGFGTWDAIERWPTLFAAAVPVSGAGDPALASRIAHLPIWAFQGGDDNVVPVAGSRNMIQAIRAAGGSPCYTEYPGKTHTIWPQVYGQTASMSNPLYPWLFAQSRNGPAPGAPACGQG